MDDNLKAELNTHLKNALPDLVSTHLAQETTRAEVARAVKAVVAKIDESKDDPFRTTIHFLAGLLTFCLGYLLWFSPQLAADAWASMQVEWIVLQAALAASDVAAVILSATSLVLLPLPLVGLALVLATMLVRLGGRLARRRAARGRRGVPPLALAPATTTLSPRRTLKENMP